MLSQSKLVLTVLVICSIVIGVGSLQAADLPKTAISHSTTSFPYLALPVSGNVNIRSGAGVAFYPCGKLKEGVKITVVEQEFGWLKIAPPKGSFSWIAKKYIDVDSANPKVGIVNAEDVRVWVGSPEYDALTSSTTQVKLSKKDFDVVELLGEEDSEYLKIAPPSGAYLFVSAEQLKYVGPVGALSSKEKDVPKKIDLKKVDPDKIKSITIDKPPVDREKDKYAKSISRSPEDMKLIIICREIADKAEAEKEKPYAEQDYTELRKAVEKIASDPKALQAKEYAKYLQNLIGRYELVSIVDSELKSYDDTLAEGLAEIERKRLEAIAAAKAKSKAQYVVKGVIKPSSIYNAGRKRYKILDTNGKTICYAVPAGDVSDSFMQRFYDKKVALEGQVDKKTAGSISLVKFTSIVIEE